MKRLRWYDYLSINLFWLGLNIRNTALGSIFMPYLVGIFAPEAIKNTALGGMRSAGLVIAMLVQPAAGMLSDRSTSPALAGAGHLSWWGRCSTVFSCWRSHSPKIIGRC